MDDRWPHLPEAEQERRRKISEANRGKKRKRFEDMDAAEQVAELARRRKLSDAKRGTKRPDVSERNKVSPPGKGHTIPAEIRKKMSDAHPKPSFGHAKSRTEGRGQSKTYMIWASMIQRCTNQNYKEWHNYGGRGITVCAEWRTFANFLADMGEKPEGLTLDRRDNDGPYSRENCRWVTPQVQAQNKRNSVNLSDADLAWIKDNAYKIGQKEMADRLGIGQSTLSRVIDSLGERKPQRRVTPADIEWVRVHMHEMTQREMCRRLDMSPPQVNRIVQKIRRGEI